MHITTESGNPNMGPPRFPVSRNVARQETMSSVEIAKLTGSSHDNVLKTVRGLVSKGVVSGNETPYIHPQNGQTYSQFLLSYRDTMVVISGYSVELRAKIIDRWQELEAEAGTAPALPSNMAEALRLAADQIERNQKLQLVIDQQTPKVEALARLAKTTGSICITDAAKHIGLRPQMLFTWMSENRWIFRRSTHAHWSAFQPRLSQGLLEYKLVKIKKDKPADESEQLKVVEQVLVTRLGLVALAEQIKGGSA